MNPALQEKCDLLADNYVVCAKSAKLDFTQAAALGALIFTNENKRADESVIRKNRSLLKSKVGLFNNMRGYTNLAMLCKMSYNDDPAGYVDKVLTVYNQLKGKVMRSEYQVLTASSIVDLAKPEQYEAVVEGTKDLYQNMRALHPLLTGHEDFTTAALLVISDLDANALLEEAERCYNELKGSHFKLSKDALQSVSMVLALSDKPTQEKCDRFRALREALKDAKSRLWAEQLPIVAALVDCDVPNDQLVSEIHEADRYLKTKKGFHGIFGVGAQLRRTMAAALVLQVHNAERTGVSETSNAVSSMITQQIIMTIVFTIIMVTIMVSIQASNSSAH